MAVTVTRKSVVVEVAATSTTILTATANTTITLHSLLLGNVDGSNDATLTLTITKNGGSAINFVTAINVEAGTMIQVLIGGKDAIILEEGDTLSATASAVSDIVILGSYHLETVS